MRLNRIIWFMIMIAAGIALGLYYAWIVNPVRFIDATFYDLRQDYKADYVLMAAEIFQENPVLFQTMIRIDRLMENSAEEAVANAISNAEKLGYSENDLDLLYNLNDAIGGRSEETAEPEDIFIEYNVPEINNDILASPVAPVIENPTVVPDNPFEQGGENG